MTPRPRLIPTQAVGARRILWLTAIGAVILVAMMVYALVYAFVVDPAL